MVPAGQRTGLSNADLASLLEEVADLLEMQGANTYRVRAYRVGAETLRNCGQSARVILQTEGLAGLMQLPGIGRSLAHAIQRMVRSGHLPLLHRLRGEDLPEKLLATVPDIGPQLARRIHEELGIETLDELHAAALDGRLAMVRGMGRKRIQAVRESLTGRFGGYSRRDRQKSPRVPAEVTEHEVPVSELLDIDEEYRRLARAGHLPRIAPRRFNPTQEAWLPILHTVRGERHYTALFSNTTRAHEQDAIRDWVIIYRDDDHNHGRWTVITAHFGRLHGRRIIRGRELECERFYGESET